MDGLTIERLVDPGITDDRIGQTFSSMIDLLLMPHKKDMTVYDVVKMYKMRTAVLLATSITEKISRNAFDDEFTFSMSISSMANHIFCFKGSEKLPGITVFIERMIYECFSSLPKPRTVKDIQWSLQDCIITVDALSYTED